MLRKKVIERYDLLPVIFSERWDSEKKNWAEQEAKPTLHDALRALERLMSVRHSPKDNTITITLESTNPRDAAQMLDKLLSVLNPHLSNEARRIADANRRYLEGQLKYTSDPLIRQNIYTLIAQQLESAMMAGVMENFAFKVIDPAKGPLVLKKQYTLSWRENEKARPETGSYIFILFHFSWLSHSAEHRECRPAL